ncbi:hypothetical protein GCM10010116_61460 [Microbispora rosea subsp. aerata]|nr:hypothetical protein [Microbispora rosea]GGO30698.1 hypothetical protein GCM10010116_61460 [Microbispora rosea subsp. aerata]GIH59032.1 hypothetical protein Mro02_59460 [Microbispora rosea subsp. aerata]GLJ85414.1 hypothetical protein GCM10017588_41460 [Microbispora rosea subsp. aerata]
MTLGILSLVLVVAVGAGVGLILRDGRSGDDGTGETATGPNTVVVKDEEITKLVEGHSKALASGDAKAFTSIFDQKNAALVRSQARVFANLSKMPLAEKSYQVLRRQGRAADSFGRGVKFTQDVAFVHRFADIDLRPVAEWYRWTIEKASPNAPLVVTKVEGAPPPTGGEESKTVYYPGPWDIWPDITVTKAGSSIILTKPQDAALARRIAPTVSAAAASDLDFWQKNGGPVTVPKGFVVALVKGKSQLGRLFRTAKADEAGVSIGMPSWGAVNDPVKVGGTRVVMDTTSEFFEDQQGIMEISKHELAHSMVAGLDSAEFSLYGKANWIVEGFAEYMADRGRPISRNRRFPMGRAYLEGRLAMPFEGKLPTNTMWDYRQMANVNYLMGHLAIRFIAEKYGEQKLVEGVVAAYQANGDESEAALFQVLGVSKAAFERQWAGYVRAQLT